MKFLKIPFILFFLFVAILVVESCSNKAYCGNKRQKKAQHAKTKKMVGTGWVQ